MVQFDIDRYIANPKKYLDSISVGDLITFLKKANDYYRNKETTLINDDLYDYAMTYLEIKDPDHPFLDYVGAEVDNKTKLPIWMGSQDKIRDDPKALTKWANKYTPPYIISDKLDGNSGLVVYKDGKFNLYTRGDGEYGQNISLLLPYIKHTDWDVSAYKNISFIVRGELIISKKNWATIKDVGANARNVVAGLLHSKKINVKVAEKLDFVAYELVEPKMDYQASLEMLHKIGISTIDYNVIGKEELTLEYLSDYLIRRREESPYVIDGVVVRENKHNPIITGKNPKYSFAFKTIHTHEQAEVVVSHIEWNVSKDGYIIPLVHFNPIYIGDVKIKQATGHHANNIKENVIGPGARIIIIRSGDVIPYILRVLSPAANGKPQFPEIEYEWNETGVDIRVKKGAINLDQQLSQMVHFVNTLDIKYVAEGIIKKLFEHGVQTISHFVALQKADLLLIEGIQEKGADKIYKSIQSRMKTVTCEELMVASNLFGRGFGLKTIQLIVQEHPDILKLVLLKELKPIKGVGPKTAKQFLEGLPIFYEFLKELGITKCKTSKKVVIEPMLFSNGQDFNGKSFVFTGFRNKEWEQKIEALGGKISGSVSKKTFMVVAGDINDISAKVVKGKELGILISKDTFAKKYNFE
uniref:DNA ligase (NAD(+)) n=1 Tax=viral metagenome TaxID=1070528 RepID=A0A6C0CTG8_9ZZZZ